MVAPQLSIIVPIYNVEKYLSRCLDSVLAQTFTEYECILVDDGSTDTCGVICDQYAAKNSRFKVIHQPHGGASVARNVALQVARGEYVAFVDSDDYILPSYCETMLKLLRQYNADIVKCDYMKGEICPAAHPVITSYTGRAFTAKILTDEIGSQLWQYIAKRNLWDGIVSPVGRWAQDMMIWFQVTGRTKTIVSTSEKLYFYFINRCDNTSNAPQKQVKKSMDRAIAFKMHFEYAQEYHYEQTFDLIMRRLLEFYNAALTLMPANEHDYDADIRDLSDFLKQHRQSWSCRKQGFKWYFIGLWLAYGPRWYSALKWFWKAGRRNSQ